MQQEVEQRAQQKRRRRRKEKEEAEEEQTNKIREPLTEVREKTENRSRGAFVARNESWS